MKYTDQELIDELHRVSEEHCDGKTPTKKDIDDYGNISSFTYNSRFGSWNKALKEANFKINTKYQYTNNEILNEVKEICKENDRVSSKTLKEESSISLSAILNNFDSIKNLLEKINEESKLTKRSKDEINKKEVIDIVSEHTNNNSIIKKKILNETKLTPRDFNKYWGSWNNFLEENEYTVNYRIYSKQEIEKSVKKLSKEIGGKMPTKKEIDRNCDFSRQTIFNKYGSFDNLARKIGKEPNDACSRRLYGKKHPNWKGGYEDYYGPSWPSQRKKAWERDDCTCRVTGKTQEEIGRRPDVHHIRPKYMWDVDEEHEEMNSLDNLVCLCPSLHNKLEGKWIDSSPNEFVTKAKKEMDI